MARDPDRKAAAIAARQYGLITWCQALFAGLSEHQIRQRVSSRRWRRVQRGVYLIEGGKASWHQTLLAAQLAARTERLDVEDEKQRLEELEDAAVAGQSALWLRACKRLAKPDSHELVVSRRRAPAINGASVRRTDELPPADLEYIDGILTLSIPRLLVDLCGRIPDVDFVAVLDDLLDPGDPGLRNEVHKRALRLRRGRKAVDRLVSLTAPGAEAAFRSWLERHTGGLFDAARIPRASWNLEVRDAAGAAIGIGDAVWAEQRVVVEVDGLRFHSSPQQRRRDNRKDRRLGAEGWLVLRYTWLDVMERPDEVVAEVRQALHKRAPTLSLAASTALSRR